jgi:hypothetical protein
VPIVVSHLANSKSKGILTTSSPPLLAAQITSRIAVLSCATCNEAEKLDGAWQEFMVQKNRDPAVLRARIAKIHEWQKLNEKPALNQQKLREIESLGDSAVALYDAKVKAARKLNKL